MEKVMRHYLQVNQVAFAAVRPSPPDEITGEQTSDGGKDGGRPIQITSSCVSGALMCWQVWQQ